MRDAHQIIKRPHLTEKGSVLSDKVNQYVFEVASDANKIEIKHAVESLFNVKVVKVYIQNRKGKPRRTRFRSGRTKDWKKAIVKLDSEHRIDFF